MQPIQDLPATGIWIPDGRGAVCLGDFTIALDPGDGSRWHITTKSGERLMGGPVLGGNDDYVGHSLTERLAADGVATDGLEEWGPWAEAQAEAARSEPNGASFDIRAALETFKRAQAKLDDAKVAVDEAEEASPRGSFADRVTATKVDLVTLMQGDLSPPPAIEGSGDVLLHGVAHLWPMERKGGKSIATLSTAVDIVLAGGTVAILDRENGKKRYALRLRDIVESRSLGKEQLQRVGERLLYYAYPRIRKGDEEELVDLFHKTDLVVYDSSRTFMASQSLKENSSDDYTEFMVSTVEPLKEAGVATLILDNSGWSDSGRPRGTSSKEDLNEQLFVSEKRKDFNRTETGEILLEIKESRDGLTGAWTMTIGGGVYEPWKPAPEGLRVGSERGKGGKRKAEKQQRLAEFRDLLAEDPDMADDDLARKLNVSPETVRRYRREDVPTD